MPEKKEKKKEDWCDLLVIGDVDVRNRVAQWDTSGHCLRELLD